MNELLIELFSEEIPARMQIQAAEKLLSLLKEEITKLEINFNKTEYFVTPRRITLYIEDLPIFLPEKLVERKGPKINAKEEAIEGFLKSVGMQKSELYIVDECYYAKKLESAKPLDSILKDIIEQILVSFTWPKSMRLGTSRNRWVRPLRNILCLFNGSILPIEFSSLKANNYSFGHRFMAPEKLQIVSFSDYKTKMQNANVYLSSQERCDLIKKDAEKLAQKLNLKVILEEGLLNEVVGLVEYPNVLLGKIDPEFINLPKEVLVSTMRNHQRYFYLEDKNGNIAPYFIFVANVKHEDDSLIIQGNEKVLMARFTDAKFFWEQDLKQPYSQSFAKLARMTFHSKLGNMFDKTNRIIALAEFIANEINYSDISLVKKASLLSKIDLVSEMVGELPELQGIMGRYYAEKFGEEKEVAIAIAEHYRPIDTNDKGDISLLGAIVAISDKIDSIVGLWIAGAKPTSSKDPFALRRAALGIIKLVKQHSLNLSLIALIEKSVEEYELEFTNEQKQEVIVFFNERLKYYLKAEDFRHDLIMATLNENSDNIYNTIDQLFKLNDFMKTLKSSELVFAIKRILKIISEAAPAALSNEVNTSLFNKTEANLYNAFINIKEIKTCENLEVLIPLIDQFFAEVMVNDSNQELKQNRLNLLNNIASASKKIADFSLIEA